MNHMDMVDLFNKLSLFDATILFRRAIIGEPYALIGEKIGYSHEFVRRRYQEILQKVRRNSGTRSVL